MIDPACGAYVLPGAWIAEQRRKVQAIAAALDRVAAGKLDLTEDIASVLAAGILTAAVQIALATAEREGFEL